MRTAIIHPWFLFLGGGERVTEVLATMYPDADIFTLFSDCRFVPSKIRERIIKTSFLDSVPFAGKFYRQLMPLHSLAAESLDLTGYDLVISSDSSVCKGVLVDQDALHVSYCHTPTRFIWDFYRSFYNNRAAFLKPAFAVTAHRMRTWDYVAAQRVDDFVANSRYIAQRIKRYYRRESTVIYPPVQTADGFLADHADDYYLSVGRLTHTKRLDLIIDACNRLGRRLLIAGVGREEKKLKAMAGRTIEFLGRVPDSALPDLYSKCRAFLFAAVEDFGMVPIEAQAYGRPVIAYGYGGSLETVEPYNDNTDRATGLFFHSQTATDVEEAIRRFEKLEDKFDPRYIRSRALTFDTSVFVHQMKAFIDLALLSRTDTKGQMAKAARQSVGHLS
jgi:glycosyltransferase involved in cell wall biosynthesis